MSYEKMTVLYSEGYRAALRDIRELVEIHDLHLGKKPRRHVLAALDCIQEDPDRFAANGGRTDLWWKEEGKQILYSFEPPQCCDKPSSLPARQPNDT